MTFLTGCVVFILVYTGLMGYWYYLRSMRRVALGIIHRTVEGGVPHTDFRTFLEKRSVFTRWYVIRSCGICLGNMYMYLYRLKGYTSFDDKYVKRFYKVEELLDELGRWGNF